MNSVLPNKQPNNPRENDQNNPSKHKIVHQSLQSTYTLGPLKQNLINFNGFNDDHESRVFLKRATTNLIANCLPLCNSQRYSEPQMVHYSAAQNVAFYIIKRKQNLCTNMCLGATPYAERVHTSVCLLATRKLTKRVPV